jgi:8-oxo-dGTP pyrophosphatase MutT (NUDIX family)
VDDERRGAHQLSRRKGSASETPVRRRRGLRTEEQHSAGGLVVRGPLILLISTLEGRRWQLPKGHLEAGETPEQAAVREVREETGVTGGIRAPLATVDYWFVERDRRRIHKQVDYFLLDYVGGDNADYDRGEVSGAEWLDWDEGLRRLTFENEREVVRQARALAELSPTP